MEVPETPVKARVPVPLMLAAEILPDKNASPCKLSNADGEVVPIPTLPPSVAKKTEEAAVKTPPK